MEPNGVGTPLAIRQTKQENKGSKPKATSILAGMAMAVPKPDHTFHKSTKAPCDK